MKCSLIILNQNKNYLKLFFMKFDAFWMLKFIHFSRDNHFSNEKLVNCANSLISKTGFKPISSVIQQLKFIRTLDKKKGNKPLNIKIL